MWRTPTIFLLLACSSIGHAIPITYVMHGTSETYRLHNDEAQSADRPLYNADGSTYFDGNTFALGSITIDRDAMTAAGLGNNWLTGGVTWTLSTEGVGYTSNYPAGGVWPISGFSATGFNLLDEVPQPMHPDNFVLNLNFDGVPFESNFTGGSFGFNNYSGVYSDTSADPETRLFSLSGRIDALSPISVPEPTSIVLLGAGFAGLIFSRRRRKSIGKHATR